jgi:hypothetical protein
MAAGVKFQQFVEDLAKGVHDFDAHTFKIYLTNTTPNVATNAVKADLAEISAGSGYTAGGNTCAFTSSEQTTGTLKFILANPASWTASGGNIGPFRYWVLYNDTSASDSLIQYWDYGASITLTPPESFSVTLDASNGVLTIA